MDQDRQTTFTQDYVAGTITKSIKPFIVLDYRGVDMAKKWPEQRIRNEATALRFIKEETTIPVPAVIDVGNGPNGFFVTTEFIDGIPLANIGDKCQMPSLSDHQPTNCPACKKIATANAKTFVEEVVLPQLSKLTSNTTGFNGFVNPPPWVTEIDRREIWQTKTSTIPVFVFCHGDLGPFNILCDPNSLEVLCLFDFENAGYFPREFLTQWAVERSGYYNLYKTMYEHPARLEKLTKALEP